MVLATAAYLLRRSMAQKMAKYNKLINAFYLVGVLYPVGLIFAAFTGPDLAVGWQNFFFMIFGSGLFSVMYLLSFRANRDIDAGVYTILNNITPIVTIAFAWILLNEKLNTQQLIGASIIISSAVLVTLPRLKRSSETRLLGLGFAISSVVVLGLAIVFERWMLTRVDFGAYLVYGWGGQALWMSVLAWPERKRLNEILKKKEYLKLVLGYSLANAFKGLAFVGALKLSGNASLVVATTSFLVVLVVFAAYFVLREREWLWLKIFTAVFGSIGLFILNK